MVLLKKKVRSIGSILGVAFFLILGCSQTSYTHVPVEPTGSSVSQTTTSAPTISPPSNPLPPVNPASNTKKNPTHPPVQSTPLPDYYYDWEKDQYPYGSEFYNRCVYPRTVDHRPGTVLDELFAMRELIANHYLFKYDYVDLDPRKYVESATSFNQHYANMTDKNSYLQQLRTSRIRPTGKPTHGMHRTWKTVYDNPTPQPSSLQEAHWLGIKWRVVSSNLPLDLRVEYTEPNAPATQLANGAPKVKRGDKLLKVNDFDVVSSRDGDLSETFYSLSRAKASTGATKFVLLDRDTKLEKTVVLNSFNYQRKDMFSAVYETDTGNVGYLYIKKIRYLIEDILDAVDTFENNGIKDLVLDIRYLNEQELSEANKTDSALAYIIAGQNRDLFSNKIAYRKRYGFSRLTHLGGIDAYRGDVPFHKYCPIHEVDGKIQCIYWASWRSTSRVPFIFEAKSFNPLDLERVFILVSNETCHVAETLINGLRGIDMEIILIGEPTCGNPYDLARYDNCGITVYLIDTRYVNDKGFGGYEEGFKPANAKFKHGVSVKGCYVENVLTKPLGDINEPLLATALKYREDESCPPVP